MTEWGSKPVREVILTDDEFGQLCRQVENILADRKRGGALESECDFLCGAMAVLERLGIRCPIWPVLMMSGRSVLDKPVEDEGYDECQKEGGEYDECPNCGKDIKWAKNYGQCDSCGETI